MLKNTLSILLLCIYYKANVLIFSLTNNLKDIIFFEK